MADTNLDELCKEIKKKAHRIVSYSPGTKTINYFIGPNELYEKIIKTPHAELKHLGDKLDGSVTLVDIENNLVTRFDKKGFIGGSYTALVKEKDRKKIERILELEKNKENYK